MHYAMLLLSKNGVYSKQNQTKKRSNLLAFQFEIMFLGFGSVVVDSNDCNFVYGAQPLQG